MSDPKRVASMFLKKAGNEYRLAVVSSNHKRELAQLLVLMRKKITEFNRDFRQDSKEVDLTDPKLRTTRALLAGDNMNPAKALEIYVEMLGDAEVELIQAAGLD